MEMSLKQKAKRLWHTQRVMGLVRDHMGRTIPCLISVRETVCTDPGCDGLATEIRVVMLGIRDMRILVHKEASDVAPSDIAAFF